MITAAEHVGARIRLYRKAKGLTLEQLARQIDRSKSTVSKYEAGAVAADINTLMTVARVLGVTLTQLTDYFEQRKSPERTKDGSLPFLRRSNLVYMYEWYKPTNTIASAIEITHRSGHIDAGTLYFGIHSPQHYTGAEYVYAGKIVYTGTWTYISMENQFNIDDQCFVIVKEPYNTLDTTVGILTGISQSQRNPMASKVLLSLNPLEDDGILKEQLRLTQETIQEIKRTNMLVVR